MFNSVALDVTIGLLFIYMLYSLFVKLPKWFQVETPVGFYNPDWAIVKEDDVKIYLVRETKATRDFEKLRNSEADKVRCGRKHFQALDVDFQVVVDSSDLR